MTGPDQGGIAPSRPARGRLSRTTPERPSAAAVEAAEVAQGQAAAVLGALARMQLRLDVLAREQSDLLGQVLTRLDELEAALAPVEQPADQTTTPQASPSADPVGWRPTPPAEHPTT